MTSAANGVRNGCPEFRSLPPVRRGHELDAVGCLQPCVVGGLRTDAAPALLPWSGARIPVDHFLYERLGNAFAKPSNPPDRGLLRDRPTPHLRACWTSGSRPSPTGPPQHLPRRTSMGSPGSRAWSFHACLGSQTARSPANACDSASAGVAFRHTERRQHSGRDYFAARYPACMCPVNASLQPCGRPRTATPVPGLKRTRNRTHARFWRLGASRKSHHRSGQIFPPILNGRDSIPSAFRILIAWSMSEQFMLMMPWSAFGLACTRIVFFKMSIARPASPGGSTESLQISGIGFLR